MPGKAELGFVLRWEPENFSRGDKTLQGNKGLETLRRNRVFLPKGPACLESFNVNPLFVALKGLLVLETRCCGPPVCPENPLKSLSKVPVPCGEFPGRRVPGDPWPGPSPWFVG